MSVKTYETEVGGRKLTIETGKVAGLANGSCLVRYGDTVVLATATASAKPREGIDFFPEFPAFIELFSFHKALVPYSCIISALFTDGLRRKSIPVSLCLTHTLTHTGIAQDGQGSSERTTTSGFSMKKGKNTPKKYIIFVTI